MAIIIQPVYEYNSRPHRRYLAFILALAIVAVIAVMVMGAVISAWQDTSRAFAREDQQNLQRKHNLEIQTF